MAGQNGSSVKFLPTGAIIQEFIVEGQNIVLGFPSAEPYLEAPFFGETVGRVANRIENGLIKDLNGRSYEIARNSGRNTCHGGKIGWGKKVFSGPHLMNRSGKETVQFTYVSPDGEEGFPGTVELRVWYSVHEADEGGMRKMILESEYEAELTGSECEETVINISNHSYFKFSDAQTIEGTQVRLSTTDHLVATDDNIPLGPVEKFPGIKADESFTLGVEEPEIDHCFVMDSDPSKVPLDTRSRELRQLVAFFHPTTKVNLEIFSTEPCFQFYTGKFIDVPASEHGPARSKRSGLCIEPSRYVNAINVPEWRHTVLLRRGQKYGAKTMYKSWKS